MSAALFLVSAIAYKDMGKIKKGLDIVYFGNIVPATKLQNILDEYSKTITLGLYKQNANMMENKDLIVSLKRAKKQILTNWQSYTQTYHTKEEKITLAYSQKLIMNSFSLLDTLIFHLENSDTKKIVKILNKQLNKNISPIEEHITKLISYEFAKAREEKKNANNLYEETTQKLIIILFLVFISVILFSIPVVKNIHRQQKYLEETTENLTEISIKDPMTSLYNRRYFDIVLPRELSRAKRDEKPINFAMLDIDHFKLYNDTYGHQMGDDVLIKVSHIIQDSFGRASDYVFRLGGEEFGVIMTNMSQDEAYKQLQKLCKSISEAQIEHQKNSVSKYVSISIGLKNVLSDHKINIKDFIEEADQALYRAKESGRNKVVLKQ
jgi:diguanylate cyclase (GGDEF)-like protein